MTRYVVWGLLAFVGMFLLSCAGLAVPLDLAVALLFGWAFYLGRVLLQVEIDGAGLATAAVCLALFGAGSHVFLGWLYRQAGGGADAPGERRWKPRWTASMVVVVVLMFVAGISAAGVVHQAGWLLTAEDSLVQSSSRSLVRRIQSSNNLRQIGVGLAAYHEAHGSFPPGGTFDAGVLPLHGWPSRLLPYVERQDLYDTIDFGVPWDDPRNRPVFRTQVTAYQHPGIPEREDAAGYALSHYAGNARLLGGEVPRTSDEVTDGLASTIMAGEVAAGFEPWGSPTNWRDPALGINRSPEGFGSPFPGGANVLFADGSVWFLKDTIDPRVLRSLSTPAGGETISPGQY